MHEGLIIFNFIPLNEILTEFGLGTAISHLHVELILYNLGYIGLVTMPLILNILPPQPLPIYLNANKINTQIHVISL